MAFKSSCTLKKYPIGAIISVIVAMHEGCNKNKMLVRHQLPCEETWTELYNTKDLVTLHLRPEKQKTDIMQTLILMMLQDRPSQEWISTKTD